jgi:hypothetical protein
MRMVLITIDDLKGILSMTAKITFRRIVRRVAQTYLVNALSRAGFYPPPPPPVIAFPCAF